MDGLTGILASSAMDLSAGKTSGAIQVKALESAMEQASAEVLPLLEDLGRNLDVTA